MARRGHDRNRSANQGEAFADEAVGVSGRAVVEHGAVGANDRGPAEGAAPGMKDPSSPPKAPPQR